MKIMYLVILVAALLNGCVPERHEVRQANGDLIETIDALGGYDVLELRFTKPGAVVPHRVIFCSHTNNAHKTPSRCIETK